MKPIKLEMEGFGSYREHTVIDFEKLNKGLYLITGPTGSGKTTIFDAISFALYGSPSGSTRTGAGLRNKNLSDDDACFVELTFRYAGKVYRINRSPQYVKLARTGSLRTINATASLELPDGNVLTLVKKVDDYITTNVMHLSKEQFSQISMLAQGEFQKMLLSPTKDKMEIFRQIFKTSLYEILTDRIRDDRKVISDKRGVLDTKIEVELKRIPDVRIDEETEGKLSEIRERHMSVADSIVILETVLDTLEMIYKDKENILSELGKKELELVNTIKEVNEYESLLVKVKDYEAKLPEATKNAETLTLRFTEAETRNGEYKTQLKLKEDENQRKLKESEALEESRKELETEKNLLDLEKRKLTALENERNLAEEELTSRTEELSRLEDHTDEKVEINAEVTKLETEHDSLSEAEKILGNVERERLEEEHLQASFKKVMAHYVDARKSYEEAYDIFYSQQAGILASTLEEGSPCPVCGSVHHPVLASLKDSSITDLELKRREKDRNDWNLKVTDAANKANIAAERVRIARDNLSQALVNLGIAEADDIALTIDTRKNNGSLKIDSLKERLAEIERDDILRKNLTVKVDELTSGIKKISSSFEDKRAYISSLEGSLDARVEEYRKNSEKLGDIDVNSLVVELRKIQSEVVRIESDYTVALRDKQNADAYLNRLKASLDSEKNRLESFKCKDVDVAVLQDNLDEVRARKSTINDEQMNLYNNISDLKGIIRNLSINQKSYDELDEEYRNIDMLYTTFIGHLTGAKRVGLETYVQMAYFDRILARANLRLLNMTNGRYEMRREKIDDISNNVSVKGLDVLIVDHYEGCDRAVQTLSGGEKFLASLCLALGLSEEIESEAGGVHLDSIFIDEGFGSLDAESISLAMKALGDLAGGEKLVGIISHVDALKDRIDKKIVVTRNMKGESKAEVIA